MKNNKSLDPRDEESGPTSKFGRWISEPLSKRGWPKWLVYLFAILGVLYMLNPTAGLFEFIPDNIPFLGNLDEGIAMMLVLAGLVEFFEGRKHKGNHPMTETPSKSDIKDVIDIIEIDKDIDS